MDRDLPIITDKNARKFIDRENKINKIKKKNAYRKFQDYLKTIKFLKNN